MSSESDAEKTSWRDIASKRAKEMIETLAVRMDEWENAMTYLGGSKDKTSYTKFIRRFAKNEFELDALFDFEDMANVIVTAEPEAMLRKGFKVRLEEPDATTRLHDELDRLGLSNELLDALVRENVHGGAAIFMGVTDGRETHEPLDLDNVISLDFLAGLDCRDLRPCDYYQDPNTPVFGKPMTYTYTPTRRSEGGITSKSVVFHESRLVLFRGSTCSMTLRREKQSWGGSKLDRSYKALQIFADNWASVGHILSDGAQGVYSMKGLIKMLGSPKRDVALERMRQVDRSRSVARALILDSEDETFERKDTNVSGLADLLDRTAHRLAASARMPVAVLMGREPSGLNATGEMDMRSWYDQVQSKQTHGLTPKIRQVVLVCCAAKKGPTGGQRQTKIDIDFPPPWTATPAERADIELKHAQTDQIRIDSQVVSPEQVAIARYRPEGYQDEINVDVDHLEASVEEMKAAIAAGGEHPPATTMPDNTPAARGTGTASGAGPLVPEAKDPTTALNGAQVTSLVEIVKSVATGQIPRETGIGIILAAFPLERAQVEEIMGSVGQGFTPAPVGATGVVP